MLIALVALSTALVLCAGVAGTFARRLRAERPAPATLVLPDAAPADPPAVVSGSRLEQSLDADGVWRTLLMADSSGPASELTVLPWGGRLEAGQGWRLSANAPLAKAVGDVLRTSQGRAVARLAADRGTDVLFVFRANAEIIAGVRSGALEVVQRVGGGASNIVRRTDTKRFVGQGAFVPVGGAGGAAVGAAAIPPLWPALAVSAVTAALEYAAEAEQRKQLQAIRQLTSAIREKQIRDEISALEAAAGAFDHAAALMLDGATVPGSVGLDTHAAAVADGWQQSLRRLQEWRQNLGRLPECLSPDALTTFAGIEDPDGEFWREIALFRSRLSLQGRRLLLTAAQASQAHPDNPYPAFRGALEAGMDELEVASDELRGFVEELSSRPIRVGRLVTGGTANQVIAVTERLQRLLRELEHPTRQGDMAVALEPGGTLAIEGVAHADGSVTMLDPAKQYDAA